MSKYEELMNARNAKIDKIIGEEISFDKFVNDFELHKNKSRNYSIYVGYNAKSVEELSNKAETRISSGTITDTFYRNDTLFVELNNDKNPSERFSKDSIKKVTKIDNEYYVIYNDNSYFRLKIVEGYKTIKKDIHDNFVEDYLNFEDTSVGIYSVGYLTDDIIRDIVSEDDIEVLEWTNESMTIFVEGYQFKIEIVKKYYNGECMDARWEIVE